MTFTNTVSNLLDNVKVSRATAQGASDMALKDVFKFSTGKTMTLGSLVESLDNDPTEQNEVDTARVGNIFKDIVATGQLRQPIVVVNSNDTCVIMSGRHRLHALLMVAALGTDCKDVSQVENTAKLKVPVLQLKGTSEYQLGEAVIDANSSRPVRPDEKATIKLGLAGFNDLSSVVGRSFSKGSTIPKTLVSKEVMRAYDGELSGMTIFNVASKVYAESGLAVPQGKGTEVTEQDLEDVLVLISDLSSWLVDNTEQLITEFGNVARSTKDVAAQYLSQSSGGYDDDIDDEVEYV